MRAAPLSAAIISALVPGLVHAHSSQPDEKMVLALQAAAVVESQAPLSLSEGRKMQQVIEALRFGDSERARGQWSQLIASTVDGGGAVDVNALVQVVLRESFLGTTEDLRAFAEKVRYFNEVKKHLREQIQRATEVLATLKKAGPRSTLEAHIKDLEEKLDSVGDDAQLANVDLQNILQKQQQTLQMMSNISKMLHDTAMAIIRKIGG
jgi:hypothetical protein